MDKLIAARQFPGCSKHHAGGPLSCDCHVEVTITAAAAAYIGWMAAAGSRAGAPASHLLPVVPRCPLPGRGLAGVGTLLAEQQQGVTSCAGT